MQLNGIHHLTAIASDPARNVAFYTQVLGLRLVKKTVNYDDPSTYHTYFGDDSGVPGTLLTFFPIPNARHGRPGSGQITAFAFQAPQGSLTYWKQRLQQKGVSGISEDNRFGDAVVAFKDPDGFLVELIETAETLPITPPRNADVPAEYALHGFHGLSMSLRDTAPSVKLLTGLMGAVKEKTEGFRTRYRLGQGAQQARIDLLELPDLAPGTNGAGIVHHIAWRTPDNHSQQHCLETLQKEGFNVSPITNRNYFKSIYYREPGGVLYEIATDPPGCTIDEPLETLGQKLMLPPWAEAKRAEIEKALPPL